tara:strand:+ start:1410 stop:2348 length:939 start_codon:yes stop_codon:yes gene_type:complete
MADNLNIDTITVGGAYDTWGAAVNAYFAKLNSAAGDVETFTETTGTVTVSQDQSNKATHVFTGALTGNVTVDVLAAIGRHWIVRNATTNAYTVTYQVTGGAGASVVVDQGFNGVVYTDGVNCYVISLATLAGTISPSQIANSAVTSDKILDANVTTAKIADANVTTAKIADANITTAKIADANVTTAKIADANVTAVKIAANAVTLAKFATQDDYTVLANISGGAAVPTAIVLQTDDTFASASNTTLATALAIKTFVTATAFSSALPSQAGNSGKFVTTDGTNASWTAVPYAEAIQEAKDELRLYQHFMMGS